MYKYYMIIDGSEYNALFVDHFEAAQFLDDNEADGSEVIVLKCEAISPRKALEDRDFSDSYAIEMVAAYLMLDRHFEKWGTRRRSPPQGIPSAFLS